MPELIVDETFENIRLDMLLSKVIEGASRSAIKRMIDMGNVLVNEKIVKPSYKVRRNDVVRYHTPESQPSSVVPEDIPIEIVYEDNDMIVINKPRGMASHPAPGTHSGTVVNAILAHTNRLSSIGGYERPGIVHRLDKYTSGLMMIARNDRVHRILQKQIQDRIAKRRYIAIVWGNPHFESAEVVAPIGRHPVDRKKMAVITSAEYSARDAITELNVIKRFGQFSLVEARLQTGRTHQVRVHSAYAGYPIVGDPLYSGGRRLPDNGTRYNREMNRLIDELHGQALHAYFLSFTHPSTGEPIEFTAEMPMQMKSIIDYLEAEPNEWHK